MYIKINYFIKRGTNNANVFTGENEGENNVCKQGHEESKRKYTMLRKYSRKNSIKGNTQLTMSSQRRDKVMLHIISF